MIAAPPSASSAGTSRSLQLSSLSLGIVWNFDSETGQLIGAAYRKDLTFDVGDCHTGIVQAGEWPPLTAVQAQAYEGNARPPVCAAISTDD